MPAPAALLDECLDVALVWILSQRGFDVVSLLTVGPRGVTDPQVLDRSIELSRVLITQNAADFKTVHAAFRRQGRAHSGIVCVPQRGPLSRRAIRAAIMLDWIANQDSASRLFVWGALQQLLEGGFRLPGFSEEDVELALGRV